MIDIAITIFFNVFFFLKEGQVGDFWDEIIDVFQPPPPPLHPRPWQFPLKVYQPLTLCECSATEVKQLLLSHLSGFELNFIYDILAAIFFFPMCFKSTEAT